jgi:hypothetical protein
LRNQSELHGQALELKTSAFDQGACVEWWIPGQPGPRGAQVMTDDMAALFAETAISIC